MDYIKIYINSHDLNIAFKIKKQKKNKFYYKKRNNIHQKCKIYFVKNYKSKH